MGQERIEESKKGETLKDNMKVNRNEKVNLTISDCYCSWCGKYARNSIPKVPADSSSIGNVHVCAIQWHYNRICYWRRS
jgi:hypothetical protein